MLHGRLVHVATTLTDLQILGCGLHQSAFGGRAPPESAERGELWRSADPLAGEGKVPEKVVCVM